jgi:hypothetical protein
VRVLGLALQFTGEESSAGAGIGTPVYWQGE